MSLALLFLYLMLNMFPMLAHPSSRACDLCAELFHELYWSDSMCVGVTLWFGCGGVVSVCRLRHQCLLLKHYFNLHTDTTPPQPNYNVTPTHIEPEQYNPWNNSQQIRRKLLRMDVLTSETCWALNNEIIKHVTSNWSLFIQRLITFQDHNTSPYSETD